MHPVQRSAYMFVHVAYPDSVFVSVSGTHRFIWSVVVFEGSQCVRTELKVSVSAAQENVSNRVNGLRRRQRYTLSVFSTRRWKTKENS